MILGDKLQITMSEALFTPIQRGDLGLCLGDPALGRAEASVLGCEVIRRLLNLELCRLDIGLAGSQVHLDSAQVLLGQPKLADSGVDGPLTGGELGFGVRKLSASSKLRFGGLC